MFICGACGGTSGETTDGTVVHHGACPHASHLVTLDTVSGLPLLDVAALQAELEEVKRVAAQLLARAEAAEREWYDAKAEFGQAMARANGTIDELAAALERLVIQVETGVIFPIDTKPCRAALAKVRKP